MVLLGLLSRLRAENVRSEVVDVTGNVNGMTNTSVKVFFGTKTRRLCPPPPPIFLLRIPLCPLHRLWLLVESLMSWSANGSAAFGLSPWPSL